MEIEFAEEVRFSIWEFTPKNLSSRYRAISLNRGESLAGLLAVGCCDIVWGDGDGSGCC